MFAKHLKVALFFALLVCITACSTAGYSSKSNLIVPKTVRIAANIPPGLVAYVPRFVESLQARGFSVGNTNDPRALVLRFEHNDSVMNLSVSAGLWSQGVPVLTASATNSGWGTALARGSALNSLVGKTAKKFDVELADFVKHTQIVPDAQ